MTIGVLLLVAGLWMGGVVAVLTGVGRSFDEGLILERVANWRASQIFL